MVKIIIFYFQVDEQISKLMKESIKDGKALDDWNKVQQEVKLHLV